MREGAIRIAGVCVVALMLGAAVWLLAARRPPSSGLVPHRFATPPAPLPVDGGAAAEPQKVVSFTWQQPQVAGLLMQSGSGHMREKRGTAACGRLESCSSALRTAAASLRGTLNGGIHHGRVCKPLRNCCRVRGSLS